MLQYGAWPELFIGLIIDKSFKKDANASTHTVPLVEHVVRQNTEEKLWSFNDENSYILVIIFMINSSTAYSLDYSHTFTLTLTFS